MDARAPDAIEPITAFRVWQADPAGYLHSAYHGPWIPGAWTTARCGMQDHSAPNERCTCGLHATKELNLAPCLALIPFLISRSRADPTPVVVGRVQLAGKVIEHDDGYRAERARIVEILPIEGMSLGIESVATRYAVPIGEEIPASSVWAAIKAIPREPEHCGGSSWPPRDELDSSLLSSWSGIVCVLAFSLFCGINAIRGILWETHRLEWSDWWLCAIALAAAAGIYGTLVSALRLWRRSPADAIPAPFRRPGVGPADSRAWPRL